MVAKTKNKKTHVSKKKVESLKELTKLASEKKTILIASIKNIPLSQYQEISKKLRGKAVVKVPRKSLIVRTLDSLQDQSAEKFKRRIEPSVAILFSDMDAFDLAAELVNKRSPAKAKAGQEAPADIEIPAGPTDLVPGPAISELGALGIQIQIDKGKINIKEPKVIARKGEKISSAAVDVMSKLGIKPFTIGFMPIAAFDTKEKKLYTEIKIDREATIVEMKNAFGKSLAFAVEIGYTSKETIGFLLAKAASHEIALEKFGSEKATEEISQENKSNSEENK